MWTKYRVYETLPRNWTGKVPRIQANTSEVNARRIAAIEAAVRVNLYGKKPSRDVQT
jgi:hypothetical protein